MALSRLDADLAGTDLWTSPRVSGRLNADRLVPAPRRSRRSASTPSPRPTAATSCSRPARGFALDGAARLVPAAHPRLDLSRLSAVRGADRLALAGPATVTVKDEGVTVAGLAIAAGSGRAHLDGTIGKTLDLRLGLKSLPLAMARIASPSLTLSGTLDGEAALTGPAASPEGRYSLSVSRLVTPETRSAGLPPIDAKASGRIEDGRAGLDGTVNAGRGCRSPCPVRSPSRPAARSPCAPAAPSMRRSPTPCWRRAASA